jgi:hypothetical protein
MSPVGVSRKNLQPKEEHVTAPKVLGTDFLPRTPLGPSQPTCPSWVFLTLLSGWEATSPRAADCRLQGSQAGAGELSSVYSCVQVNLRFFYLWPTCPSSVNGTQAPSG